MDEMDGKDVVCERMGEKIGRGEEGELSRRNGREGRFDEVEKIVAVNRADGLARRGPAGRRNLG